MFGFWLFMLAAELLISLDMLILGRHFRNHPSKQIQSAFGYPSARSMKNQDTWAFAHRCCGSM